MALWSSAVCAVIYVPEIQLMISDSKSSRSGRPATLCGERVYVPVTCKRTQLVPCSCIMLKRGWPFIC